MILDKLIEKKDLEVYIKLRLKMCKYWLEHIKMFPVKERGFIQERLHGRMRELDMLLKNINTIKKEGKNLWREVALYDKRLKIEKVDL